MGELGRGLDKTGSTDRVGLMAKAILGKGKKALSQRHLSSGGWSGCFFVPFGFLRALTLAGMERGFCFGEKPWRLHTCNLNTLEAEAGGLQVH